MHLYQVFILLIHVAEAVEVGKEVEGGVQLLSVGPVQLILPDILSFTIKNTDTCIGYFEICYVSDPTASRHQLWLKYHNVGAHCPPGYCTLAMKPLSHGVFGLAAEAHDGTFYGMFNDGGDLWCPRYTVDGVSNFTVNEVPPCAVIVDGARLPNGDVKPKDKAFNKKWIIAICGGLALLMLVAGIVGLYICTRPRKEAVHPVKSHRNPSNSSKSHPRTSPINKRDGTPHASGSRSPKTPLSYKEPFGKTELSLHQISPNTNPNNISNSTNDI